MEKYSKPLQLYQLLAFSISIFSSSGKPLVL